MADAAAGFLLENLSQLLQYNAELLGDSKKQVEGLLKDLNLFKAFIKEFTEKRITNPTLVALVDKIRTVVDEAEDTIDKFIVHKAIYKGRGFPGRALHAIDHSVTIRNVAKEIESIRREVSDIYTKQQFGFNALQQEPGPAELQKPPTVEEVDVVGFDGEATTVIERLMRKDHEDLEVITIIGMPGLGKTTLARKIYNDPRIEYEFFTRAWVFVSQTYSIREIFLSLLSTFTQTKNDNLSDDDIVKELHNHLEEGKYLIVMDDVWTKKAWDDLAKGFPKNKKGSRILITSRQNEVARHANPTDMPHNLKFLSTSESWELLEKKVFGKEKCPGGELEMLGQLIATECKGLPLAIVVIAGILLNNRESSDWWKQVAKDVGAFIISDQGKLLALSYNHLPYHLKSCFLYLGVFPEDYEIPVWKLIRLWIAEGFVEQNEWQLSLEAIANSWVEDLVNRNLLMIAAKSSSGHIKTCRVHDILLDFCKKEAQKQKLYQEIKDPMQGTIGMDKYRRVCIHSGVDSYISLKPSEERVRSFLCFMLDEYPLPRDHISTIFKAFELLRVLDIKSIIFKIFPKDLFQLALLRYIALSFDQVKTIPLDISKLWNMQTMIFLTKARTLDMRGDIWKMYQLRHLYTNASTKLPCPSKTPAQTNVQSLSMISPESCTKEVFARTPNIKKLGVRGKISVLFSKFFDNIKGLEELTNLKLLNDVHIGSPLDGKISGLPSADKFPVNLQKLTLSETFLGWDHMDALGNLGKLEVLKLKDNAFKGAMWQTKGKGFPALKFLHIGRTDLVTWNASKEQFPSLTCLVLQHCDKLGAVPSDFADIETFRVLELHRLGKAAATSAREIREKKNAKQGQDTKTSGSFKLAIYPPDIA